MPRVSGMLLAASNGPACSGLSKRGCLLYESLEISSIGSAVKWCQGWCLCGSLGLPSGLVASWLHGAALAPTPSMVRMKV